MPIIYEKCPYCKAEQEIELDGTENGETQIIECDDCKEKFNFEFEYSIDSYSWKIGGNKWG